MPYTILVTPAEATRIKELCRDIQDEEDIAEVVRKVLGEWVYAETEKHPDVDLCEVDIPDAIGERGEFLYEGE